MSENSWYLLMEHHSDACKILKQIQDSDRLGLIRMFDIISFVECPKIDYT